MHLFPSDIDEDPAPLNPLWLPIALTGGLLFTEIPVVGSILAWLIGMIFHETGHAVVFWLDGRAAIPAFGMTVPLNNATSLPVLAAFFGCAGGGAYFALRSGYRALAMLLIAFMAVSIWVNVFFSDKTVEMIMLYGGLGGELYLGALAIMLAWQPMPRRFNWSTARLVVLILGAVSFTQAVAHWYRIGVDGEKLPMGALLDFSALFGGPSGGDLDRLMRDHQWTPELIVSVYTRTALVCASALTAWFLYIFMEPLYRLLPNRSKVG